MLRILAQDSNPDILKRLFQVPLTTNEVPHAFHTTWEALNMAVAEGDTLLVMGKKHAALLQDWGLFKKNSTVNYMRGTVAEFQGVNVMVTYDPFAVNTDTTVEPELAWDIQLAIRYHNYGTLKPPIGEYRWATDENIYDLCAKLNGQVQLGKLPVLSVDLETIGLDEFAPEARILTISFTHTEGQADVLRIPDSGLLTEFQDQSLRFLLEHPRIKKIGANLKFDIRWIKRHWQMDVVNFSLDTGVVGSLLDENRSNSLNLHTKIYTPLGGYDDDFNLNTDKDRMDLALESDPDSFLTYAGGDTDAALRVYNQVKPALLKDRKLSNFYVRLLHPALDTFAKMEHRGVHVDRKAYKELEVEVTTELGRLHDELYKFVPARIKNKYAADFKFSRPVILRDLFFSKAGYNLTPKMLTDKEELPSTKLDHFKMWQDDEEIGHVIELLEAYNSASKTLSTYVVGFQEHIRSDGLFHPAYFLYASGHGGTVTGRTSCTAPAYQTIPKHTIWAKPLRRAFIAPEGMAILKLDFSQGELRITACVANEPTMISSYQQGIDLHSVTAAKLNNMSLEAFMALPKEQRGELRFGGKAGNFGLIYGMMPTGFRTYARDTYGVKLTPQQAIDFRDGFFELYSRLPAWHKAYKDFAKKHRYVRSPLGRIRHLPLINSPDAETRSKQERQSINSPVQGSLSDMMLLAMVLIDRQYPDLHMFGMTHDEVQCYVPIDEIQLWARRLKDIMENLPLQEYFGWTPQVPFIADAEASITNLADCDDVVF